MEKIKVGTYRLKIEFFQKSNRKVKRTFYGKSKDLIELKKFARKFVSYFKANDEYFRIIIDSNVSPFLWFDTDFEVLSSELL